MNWITRENAKVDRVACPWLIRKFIGFALLHGRDDQRKIALQTPLYDALYAWCGAQAEPEGDSR